MNTPSNTPSIDAREELFHDINDKILNEYYSLKDNSLTLPDLQHSPIMSLIDQYVSERVKERINSLPLQVHSEHATRFNMCVSKKSLNDALKKLQDK